MGGSWEDLLWVDCKFLFYWFCPISMFCRQLLKSVKAGYGYILCGCKQGQDWEKGCNINFDLLFLIFLYFLCALFTIFNRWKYSTYFFLKHNQQFHSFPSSQYPFFSFFK
jgi:hypothetical protein